VQFPNSIGADNYTGRVFRIDASTTPATFAPITDNGTNSGTAPGSGPHADSRGMVFDASNNLLEVDDGGIFKQSGPSTNTGNWGSIVGNLQVSELHDVDFDASRGLFSRETKTGSPAQTATGATSWTELFQNGALSSAFQGDGGDVAVDNSGLNSIVISPAPATAQRQTD